MHLHTKLIWRKISITHAHSLSTHIQLVRVKWTSVLLLNNQRLDIILKPLFPSFSLVLYLIRLFSAPLPITSLFSCVTCFFFTLPLDVQHNFMDDIPICSTPTGESLSSLLCPLCHRNTRPLLLHPCLTLPHISLYLSLSLRLYHSFALAIMRGSVFTAFAAIWLRTRQQADG